MDGAGILDLKAITAEIAENNRKLDGCSRHLFSAENLAVTFKCKKCHGEMYLPALHTYIKGYEAAGKSGNDILPGWKPETKKRKFFGQSE